MKKDKDSQVKSSHDYAYVRDMRIVSIFVNGVFKVEIKVDYDSANDTPSKDKAGLAIRVTSPHPQTQTQILDFDGYCLHADL